MGMITKEQLHDSLEAQKESSTRRRLGAIMRARRYMTEEQIKEILSVQGKTPQETRLRATSNERVKLLGEVLVDLGHIDRQTLATILERYERLRSEESSPRLSKLLISLGKITRAQVEQALSILARELK
jgi:hypothetical protein